MSDHAAKVPPSQVTNLHATMVTPTSVGLAWNAPKTGTPPILYSVFIRKGSAALWDVATGTAQTSATISGLKPSTTYEFEILAHNW